MAAVKRIRISAAVLAAALAAFLWYIRLLPLSAFLPEEPLSRIYLFAYRFLPDPGQEEAARQMPLLPEDPAFSEVRQALPELRFRRAPVRSAIQAADRWTGSTPPFPSPLGAAYHGHVTLDTGPEMETALTLEFHVKQWELCPSGGRSRIVTLSGGEAASAAFREAVWALPPREAP